MLSLTIAGGIFLLDYKIKEHIDSTRLQGSKEEVLGGRLLLRNCHNKDKILGKVKIGRENCQELAAAGMGCVAGEYWHQLLHGGNGGKQLIQPGMRDLFHACFPPLS